VLSDDTVISLIVMIAGQFVLGRCQAVQLIQRAERGPDLRRAQLVYKRDHCVFALLVSLAVEPLAERALLRLYELQRDPRIVAQGHVDPGQERGAQVARVRLRCTQPLLED